MKKRSRWRNWLIGGRSDGNLIDEVRRQARQGLPLGVEALEHRALLAAGVTANYAVVNDWQTGFQAQMQLVNQQPTSLAGWQLRIRSGPRTSRRSGTRKSSAMPAITTRSAGAGVGQHAGGQRSRDVRICRAAADRPRRRRTTSLNGVAARRFARAVANLSIADVSQAEGNSGTTNFTFNVTLSAPSAIRSLGQLLDGQRHGLGRQRLHGRQRHDRPSLPARRAGRSSRPGARRYDARGERDLLRRARGRPVGATLARQTGHGHDRQRRYGAASGNFIFKVSTDWGSGFTGEITAKNASQQAISNWQLEFDFPGQITSIWDASVVSHVGNHYVIARRRLE